MVENEEKKDGGEEGHVPRATSGKETYALGRRIDMNSTINGKKRSQVL